MGGPSAEHEVSLSSGKQVLANLDKEKYQPIAVKISKTGRWQVNGCWTNYADVFKKVDLAFLALHGEWGEDGKIQGLLEFHGVPYTGSNAAASALAMDKMKSRELFKLAGITTPKTLHIKKGENSSSVTKFFTSKIVKFPVVVKPCSRGSSVGVSIVVSDGLLPKAVKLAFQFDDNILIEEHIDGIEVTCGVLENFKGQKHFALPITQITPIKRRFFDYKAKYTAGASKEITPAQIDETRYKKVQDVAIRAHQLLGCRGYSRADMILRNGAVYLLEVNTLPGLTRTSLLPQAAAAAGLSMLQLLDKIIETSLAKTKNGKKY